MRFSIIQWSYLALIALAVAAGQIMFKATSVSLDSQNVIVSLLRSPIFWLAITLYGGATVGWVMVIRDIPISRAYMFMALTYVFVPFLSAVFLKEQINASNVIASMLIISGIAVAAYAS